MAALPDANDHRGTSSKLSHPAMSSRSASQMSNGSDPQAPQHHHSHHVRHHEAAKVHPGLWHQARDTSFMKVSAEVLEHMDEDEVHDLEIMGAAALLHGLTDEPVSKSVRFKRQPSTVGGSTHPGDFHALLHQLGTEHDRIVHDLRSRLGAAESKPKGNGQSYLPSPPIITSEEPATEIPPSAPCTVPEEMPLRLEQYSKESVNTSLLEPSEALTLLNPGPQGAHKNKAAPVHTYELDARWRRSEFKTASSRSVGAAASPMGGTMVRTDSEKNMGKAGVEPADDYLQTGHIHEYRGILRRFIGLPTHPRRVAWDLVGGVLILFDLVTIPLKVFDPPEDSFSVFMDWFALVFWTLNMFASLTVAYLKNGIYEMDPIKILANYMKFWFWIDLIVVGPDWGFSIAQAAMGTQSNAGSSVKLLRILRLVRCMRLLRLAKLK